MSEVKSSVLPARNSRANWGMFGYEGAVCDLALKGDDPGMMRECIALGFVDADTRMLNGTVMEYALKYAPKCAEVLAGK